MKRPFKDKRIIGPFVGKSYNSPKANGFIFNHNLSHFMWERVGNSLRVKWDEDDRLDLRISKLGETDDPLRRKGTKEYEDSSDWVNSTLGFNAVDPSFTFEHKNVRETLIAGQATTSLGVRFWWEGKQRKNQNAVYNPIRIPATESIRKNIIEWANDRDNSEVTRTKGAVFEERFSEVEGIESSMVQSEFSDVHLKVESITTMEEAKDIFEKALNWTERGVREVS